MSEYRNLEFKFGMGGRDMRLTFAERHRHTGDGASRCDLCDFTTRAPRGLYRHYRRRHRAELDAEMEDLQADKPFRCMKDGAGFFSIEKARRHTNERGTDHVIQGFKENEFDCDDCPLGFKTKIGLGVHRAKVHNKHARRNENHGDAEKKQEQVHDEVASTVGSQSTAADSSDTVSQKSAASRRKGAKPKKNERGVNKIKETDAEFETDNEDRTGNTKNPRPQKKPLRRAKRPSPKKKEPSPEPMEQDDSPPPSPSPKKKKPGKLKQVSAEVEKRDKDGIIKANTIGGNTTVADKEYNELVLEAYRKYKKLKQTPVKNLTDTQRVAMASIERFRLKLNKEMLGDDADIDELMKSYEVTQLKRLLDDPKVFNEKGAVRSMEDAKPIKKTEESKSKPKPEPKEKEKSKPKKRIVMTPSPSPERQDSPPPPSPPRQDSPPPPPPAKSESPDVSDVEKDKEKLEKTEAKKTDISKEERKEVADLDNKRAKAVSRGDVMVAPLTIKARGAKKQLTPQDKEFNELVNNAYKEYKWLKQADYNLLPSVDRTRLGTMEMMLSHLDAAVKANKFDGKEVLEKYDWHLNALKEATKRSKDSIDNEGLKKKKKERDEQNERDKKRMKQREEQLKKDKKRIQENAKERKPKKKRKGGFGSGDKPEGDIESEVEEQAE